MSPSKLALKNYISEVCGGQDAEAILSTAELAHTGQMRRSGEPYIEHPIAVANIISRYYPGERLLCTAALLHDTLEDAVENGNFRDEQELVDTIKTSYDNPDEGLKVLSIVYALTHAKDVEYGDYVLKLSTNPDALKIKLADMLHNLTSSPSEKQAKKYEAAITSLEQSSGGPPADVSLEHWEALKQAVNNAIITETLREVVRIIINDDKGYAKCPGKLD
jgi:(p)ppGpp synthase/HD superfamily hydrolase